MDLENSHCDVNFHQLGTLSKTSTRFGWLKGGKWGFPKMVVPNNHGFFLLKMISLGCLGIPPFKETPKWRWRVNVSVLQSAYKCRTHIAPSMDYLPRQHGEKWPQEQKGKYSKQIFPSHGASWVNILNIYRDEQTKTNTASLVGGFNPSKKY